MARVFTSTTYLEANTAAASTMPLTMATRFKPSAATAILPLIGIADKDVTNVHFWLLARGDVAGDPLEIMTRAGSDTVGTNNFRLEDTTNSFTSGAWNTAVGVWAGLNDRRVYLNADNANKGSSTLTGNTPLGLDRTSIGRLGDSTPTGMGVNCDLADIAIWSTDLTLEEIQSYHNGVSPRLIRPGSLVLYCPLIRETIDSRGLVLTDTGTTVTDHPPVIGLRYRRPISRAAAGSTTFSLAGVAWDYFANDTINNFQFHVAQTAHQWQTDDVSIGASTNVSLAGSAWQWATNKIQKNFQFHLSGTSWDWTTNSPQVQKAIDLASSTWQWTTNAITKTVNFKPILDAALWRWSANAFVAFQLPYHLIRSLTRPLYRAIVKKITRNST